MKKKHTEETKKLIAKPGKLNPMFGRKHSIKTINLIKARMSRNKVGLFDINHELIKEFNSNVEVATYLNCNKTTVGRYLKAGKIWKNMYYIKKL